MIAGGRGRDRKRKSQQKVPARGGLSYVIVFIGSLLIPRGKANNPLGYLEYHFRVTGRGRISCGKGMKRF